MGTDAVASSVKKALRQVAEKSMEDGIVTTEEDKTIDALLAAYELSVDDIDRGTQELLAKGNVIRDLMSGNVQPCFQIDGLPFKLMKTETLIWGFIFPLYEMKTKTQFVGGSQGVSIRIMKGVYWRVGGFKGERVSREELASLGNASTAITSKHLYFSVGLDSHRIKHDKIISIVPYKDGVAVISDGRAKPLIFLPDDPWFFINVLQNAQNWDM